VYIAVWRQNSTWFLVVSQKGVDYLSSPMSNGFDVKGIKEFRLVAGPAQGVEFYIRDVFVSDGREYNKDSISVNANKFFNHGCDTFSGVPSNFEDGPLFETPSGTIYTFNGNQTTASWNNSNTTVVGAVISITIPTYWTFELDIKKGAPTLSNEYHFLIANGGNTGRGINFNTYSSFNTVTSSGNVDLGISSTWAGWASFKFVRDSSGLKIYFNSALKGTMVRQ
jgi:hypothetical protein